MSHSLFDGRQLCIATKHAKESVIGPILQKALGVTCFVPTNFDTDLLGTFSGEIERKGNPIETAREKCRKAMEETGCDLAIASEGSFGSHPTLFFSSADEEFLLLIDSKNNLEIVVRYLTADTNFGGSSVDAWESLELFANQAKFPGHGLIIKNSEKDWKFLRKGIQTEKDLKLAFESCMKLHGTVFVETDMRAMQNPTRMRAIREVTEALVRKIESECPECHTPGFDVVEHQPGLPCSNCSMPTRSTLQVVSRCAHCNFEQIEKFPRGKVQEDPMYCDFCNP